MSTIPIGLFIPSIIFIFVAYLYPTIFFIKNTISEFRKDRENTKGHTGNNLLCIFLFLFLFFNTIYILICLWIVAYEYYFIVLMFTIVPIGIFWFLFLASTVLYRKIGKIDTLEKNKKLQFQLKYSEGDKNSVKWDIKRKASHIAFFFILYIIIIVAISVGKSFNPSLIGSTNLIWEFESESTTAELYYLDFLINPSVIIEFGFVHLLLIIGYIISTYIFVMFEVIRHSKFIYFPTTPWFTRFLRKDELKSVASYCFFFLSTQFTAFLLPPVLSIAIIGVSSIGDSLSSQIGLRFGKKIKISVNPLKSWIGAIAGATGSFLIGILFLGPIYGLVVAITFLLVDIFTEKPIKISDNLLNPVLMTVVFIILILMDIPIQYPFFLYI
ncbi:MAG: hypothetical protein ACTSWY_10220 [Promethearchaeota archaeon]